MARKTRVPRWIAVALAALILVVSGTVVGPALTLAALAPCDPTVPDWPGCLPSRAQIAAAVRTQANQAYFWSGGAYATAAATANQFPGGTTLEQALERANLALPGMDAPRSPEGDAAWEFASRTLAQQAAGQVHVIVGNPPRPNNVWESIEFPTLQANPNVSCVIRIVAATGAEDVLWNRPESSARQCRVDRALEWARLTCPYWENAAWPRTVLEDMRRIDMPNSPQPEAVLYGGQPRPEQSTRVLYSLTPTHVQPTVADATRYVYSTPVLEAHMADRNHTPDYFYLHLDADESADRRLTPEQIGCQPGKDLSELRKRYTGPPNADPSVLRVGSTYYSVESADGRLYVRSAPSTAELLTAPGIRIWTDLGRGEIWAPEITFIDGRFYIYFSAGEGANHRMYVISSTSPDSGYGDDEQKLNLPDDKWAIDGAAFTFNSQLWFVWSGWAGDTNVEQNLYIARMSNPTTPTGQRHIISQPREPWERVVGNPFVNEAPEPIKDPNGQLHIVYSANGSWSEQYCLGDLRLRAGGDPTYVWDWYKSNGCVMGSNPSTMMAGFSATRAVNGPGHHSFVLLNGDISTSPPAGQKFPLMYHAVAKDEPYSWDNRRWRAGAFGFYPNISYSRNNVPGDNINSGYSIGFFEDPDGPLPPPPSTGVPGQTSIHNSDPSVIRVGSTYYSVESDGTNIYSRSASSPDALSNSARTLIWSSPKNMPNVWAPDLVKLNAANNTSVYAIYFASGDGKGGQRMYYTWSNNPDHGFGDPIKLNLPDNKWAVDGTAFYFANKMWFVWSGWEGDTNTEQNLYIAEMTSPSDVKGPRKIISQAREPWERVVGNPFINEAPQPIKDPNGQLHIVYSANGSWSDQYCLADLRLRAGGDPMYVWDWYKSNGCLFGSHRETMMQGWDPTLYVNGPGHLTFVLLDGDIATSPPAGPKFPLMFHAVPKGVNYTWTNRMWFSGTFCWWGNTTYSRKDVPGANTDTGWSLKFFE